jgi:hypothetical protein
MNIMLDLETLGVGHNPVILSIGAVAFDKNGVAAEFYWPVNPVDCQKYGLQVDASTVLWWMRQSDEARKAFDAEGISLIGAVTRFNNFVEKHAGAEGCVWGNGATADNVWIRSAMKAVGLEPCWSFRKDRCYRTVVANYPDLEFERVGTFHNALDDAKSQALHLIKTEWLK